MADLAGIADSTRMPRLMDSPLRRLLMLLAVAAVLGLPACGDDDDSGNGGDSGGTATQEDTGTETTSPADAEAALKDTSTKPEIPKPTGAPPRKLVVEDIVKGKGAGAKKGDTVVVHYVGMNFSNGQEFDASWDTGSPFPVQLGQGMVIAGWDQGLIGIKKGGRRKLTIPPELGYGAQGYPPDIPPNETLVFVVDAVDIK
jgi:peptidylprolyl isomerase